MKSQRLLVTLCIATTCRCEVSQSESGSASGTFPPISTPAASSITLTPSTTAIATPSPTLTPSTVTTTTTSSNTAISSHSPSLTTSPSAVGSHDAHLAGDAVALDGSLSTTAIGAIVALCVLLVLLGFAIAFVVKNTRAARRGKLTRSRGVDDAATANPAHPLALTIRRIGGSALEFTRPPEAATRPASPPVASISKSPIASVAVRRRRAAVVVLLSCIVCIAAGIFTAIAFVAKPPPPTRIFGHLQTTNFTYDLASETGPSHWGLIAPEYAACGSGQTQSPINFARPGGVDVSRISASTPLWRKNDITRYDVVSRVGHPGFQVQPNSSSLASAAWWIVEGHNYTLLQFHYHMPSEHTVNGIAYAAEAHFVYRCGETGQIAVFGILYARSAAAPDNPFMAPFFPHIHTPTPGVFVNASGMANDVDDFYFTYSGSLTTPPCTEAIAWHVAHSSSPMSAAQVLTLSFALGDEPNARPVQPALGRTPLELAFGPRGASTLDGTSAGAYGGSFHGTEPGWDPNN